VEVLKTRTDITALFVIEFALLYGRTVPFHALKIKLTMNLKVQSSGMLHCIDW
jgi:hypothetical protein